MRVPTYAWPALSRAPATAGCAAPRQCPVCTQPIHGPFALCFCCTALVAQLHVPLVPVVAMVDYRVGDQMHRHLRGYKDAPVAEVRQRHRDELVRGATDWITTNGPLLDRRFGARPEIVATVPSSRRPGRAPVDAVVSHIPDLAASHRTLLVRGTGTTDHLLADRHGFQLDPGTEPARLRGVRVLLIDDSVVTGARAQSAALALRLAGVRVTGVLAIGRAVRAPVPVGGA